MSGAVTTQKKLDVVHGGMNKSAHAGAGAGARKLEESTEDFKHNTVNKDLSKAIQQARLAKKLTQAQLATQINEVYIIIYRWNVFVTYPRYCNIPDSLSALWSIIVRLFITETTDHSAI